MEEVMEILKERVVIYSAASWMACVVFLVIFGWTSTGAWGLVFWPVLSFVVTAVIFASGYAWRDRG